MARSPGDIPLHIERLVRQVRRLDTEHAALKRRLDRGVEDATADRLRREMADLKNRRVTPAGEVEEWLETLPPERRALVGAWLGTGGW